MSMQLKLNNIQIAGSEKGLLMNFQTKSLQYKRYALWNSREICKNFFNLWQK